MTTGYTELSFPDDTPTEDAFVTGAIDAYAAEVPGWVPSDGDPAVPILSVCARLIHATRGLTRDTGKALFAWFGRTLINLPSAVEAKATLTAQIAFSDTYGHTIAAGTTLTWTDPESEQLLEFEVATQVTIAPGEDSATVPLRAVFPGAEYNALPDGAPLVLVDALAGATEAVAMTAASGGVDPEPIDEYVDDLAAQLRTLRVSVANEDDAMVLARRVPGVHRAFALDGWDPDSNTINSDVTNLDVGIVFLDEPGQDVPDEVGAAAIAYLSSRSVRTVGVELQRGHPTYTDVAVVYAATCDAGFDPVVVKSTADQAVIDLLDPALFSGGRAEPPEWRGENTIRRLDVANAIGRVPGIVSLQTLTLNGGTSDVVLTGRAPLPSAFEVGGSTVAGTVVPS